MLRRWAWLDRAPRRPRDPRELGRGDRAYRVAKPGSLQDARCGPPTASNLESCKGSAPDRADAMCSRDRGAFLPSVRPRMGERAAYARTSPRRPVPQQSPSCFHACVACPESREAGWSSPFQPLAATEPLPGPSGESRNSRQEIRTFAFQLRGLWRYCDRRSRLTVRVEGRRLPIVGHGMFLKPVRRGRDSVDTLRSLFDSGYVLSQMGDVQLSEAVGRGLAAGCHRALLESA